ncbi:hypothetical protein [Delftia phage PhiW-14]|uniref:Uncharacterized protein n=1 Tax=Delftia phage PhiW-14 TaxID=665032 RepID=C9DG33_BPW14|nr:hypothetical protein DP-phiW-14_gp062 [Delftia phage PhiW-14]ACV50084.1 hypothetical protein [Delftia phage PhiW-14]
MSDLLRAATARSVGTTAVAVYTAPAGRTSVAVGFNVCNMTNSVVKFDMIYRSAAAVETYIARNFMIPPGAAYIASGGEQKFCINAGDSLMIKSDTAASLDVHVSVSEVP